MKWGRKRIRGGVFAVLFLTIFITLGSLLGLAVELGYLDPVKFEQPEEPKKKKK